MKNYRKLFIVILIFLSGSCSKYDCWQVGVPDATKEGKNRSGCIVNGIVVRPTTPMMFGYAPHRLTYEKDTGRVYISLRDTYGGTVGDECGRPWAIDVRLAAYNVFDIGKFRDNDIYATVEIQSHPHNHPHEEFVVYRYRPDLEGLSASVEITRLDTNNRIISGIFDFEAYEEIDADEFNQNEKIHVINGVFDLRY